MRRLLRGPVGTWALRVAAVLAIPIALALLVLAVDVVRAPAQLEDDDRRFATMPNRQAGLWGEAGFLPGSTTRRLLALEDDVELRRLFALYLRIEPGRVEFQGFPEREAMRAKAQFELTRKSRAEPDPKRRSRLLTLNGVMTLDRRPINDEEEQNILRSAVEDFRAAIQLDPSNEEAKTNLETLLRLFGPVTLVGQAPSGGRNEGNVSGQGSTGSGY